MPFFHAVVQIDHHGAKVLQFLPDELQVRKVTAHRNYADQDYGDVCAEHEFFGEVCDSLANISMVLIAGPQTAQADFRSYVEKHHTVAMPQVVGWTGIDHATESQLIALARAHFSRSTRRPTRRRVVTGGAPSAVKTTIGDGF